MRNDSQIRRSGLRSEIGGSPPGVGGLRVEGGRVRLAEKLPKGSGPAAAEVGWRRFW